MTYLHPRKEFKNVLQELKKKKKKKNILQEFKLSNTEDKVHIFEACVMYWKYQHGSNILCDHL